MLDVSWLTARPSDILAMFLSGLGVYVVLLCCTRLVGLRSFAKMSSFDFAITVAFGTILASTMLAPQPSLITGVAGLIGLFAIQTLLAMARRHSRRVGQVVDNPPRVLMAGAEILPDNLDTAQVTVDDLRAKLRQAGITHRDQVLAVIMESTGDISVLRHSDRVEAWIFDNIRDGAQVPVTQSAD